MEHDKRALTQWDKAEVSYKNYIEFIEKKSDKFKLTLIDLLYVSNFKGGYATINEPEKKIEDKLSHYEQVFKEIHDNFTNKILHKLQDDDLSLLITLADKALNLTDYKNETKIDGFSVSFLTTLLHFYFPNLFPILDRRVLNGLGLLTKYDFDKQGQVKNLKNFYPKLIQEFQKKTINKTIRELDKELFIITLSKNIEE